MSSSCVPTRAGGVHVRAAAAVSTVPVGSRLVSSPRSSALRARVCAVEGRASRRAAPACRARRGEAVSARSAAATAAPSLSASVSAASPSSSVASSSSSPVPLPFVTGSLAPAAGAPAPSAPGLLAACGLGEEAAGAALPRLSFAPISEAIAAVARGELVVVLDDEDRENEGDLIGAADLATEASVAFMVCHTSGLICVGASPEILDRLSIPLMVADPENEDEMRTAFTVTVDARHGTTTGISAAERARTLRVFSDPASAPRDLRRPGHVLPLRARPGGVLERPGHTEAGADLARLAGRAPAGFLCEIVAEDGTMARAPQLVAFAKAHGLCCITIADLARYRKEHNV